jgi:hypothetical protein
MIKEFELRLGNIVNDEYTSVVGILGNGRIKIQLRSNPGNGFHLKEVDSNDIKPILLTGPLLQKMLFIKDNNADFFSRLTPDGNTIAVRPGNITYVYIYRGDYEHRTRISQQENMPVHYFQNLFYILTGIECLLEVAV